MTPEKRPRGRPSVPPDDQLKQRSIRLHISQWAKVDDNGGLSWLRKLIDQAPSVKKKPPPP